MSFIETRDCLKTLKAFNYFVQVTKLLVKDPLYRIELHLQFKRVK